MDDKSISEQEMKLGQALMEIFRNYNNIFVDNSNNNKFNKNVVLFEIREMTNLSTKEIRNSLKRYKKIYQEIINDMLK
jgi:5S rRNA maturation endonuclease (ribonuclease M5)